MLRKASLGFRYHKKRCFSSLNSTVNVEEKEKFTGVDWDSAIGQALANMHDTRMDCIKSYFKEKNINLKGLRVVDIGCGGGLLSSSLVQLGAEVVSIDIVPENVERTMERARITNPLAIIEGRVSTVEELLKIEGPQSFDAVMSLEVVEHVNNPSKFIQSCCSLSKQTLVLSTLNRTVKSYALAILAAENLTGMVPVGTHDWNKFIQPMEIEKVVHAQRLHTDSVIGLVYNPILKTWSKSECMLDVNYMYFASR